MQLRNIFPKQCFSEVICIGEELDFVLWQGKQWAVTEYGVECRNGNYAIDSKWFVQNDEKFYGWVRHMSEKTWVDILEFENARIAFYLLFDKEGKRNNTKAPKQMTEDEVEQYALFHAEQAYQEAKSMALRGEI